MAVVAVPEAPLESKELILAPKQGRRESTMQIYIVYDSICMIYIYRLYTSIPYMIHNLEIVWAMRAYGKLWKGLIAERRRLHPF